MTGKSLYECLKCLNKEKDVRKLATAIKKDKAQLLDDLDEMLDGDTKTQVLEMLREHSNMLKKVGDGLSVRDLPKKLPFYGTRDDHVIACRYWEVFNSETNLPFELLRCVFIKEEGKTMVERLAVLRQWIEEDGIEKVKELYVKYQGEKVWNTSLNKRAPDLFRIVKPGTRKEFYKKCREEGLLPRLRG